MFLEPTTPWRAAIGAITASAQPSQPLRASRCSAWVLRTEPLGARQCRSLKETGASTPAQIAAAAPVCAPAAVVLRRQTTACVRTTRCELVRYQRARPGTTRVTFHRLRLCVRLIYSRVLVITASKTPAHLSIACTAPCAQRPERVNSPRLSPTLIVPKLYRCTV